MFIETLSGVMVPLSRIEKAYEERSEKFGGEKRVTLHVLTLDNMKAYQTRYTLDEFKAITGKMVKANRGFEAVFYSESDSPEFWTNRVPIIAWLFTGNHEDNQPTPVTAEGVASDNFVVLNSNGIVWRPYCGWSDTFDKWKDQAEAQWNAYKR